MIQKTEKKIQNISDAGNCTTMTNSSADNFSCKGNRKKADKSNKDGCKTTSGSDDETDSSIPVECSTAADSDNDQDSIKEVLQVSGHGSSPSVDHQPGTTPSSQKGSATQRAPEVTLDEDFFKSSFHRHEKEMESQRQQLKDLTPSKWPMEMDPVIRQELAWEALRKQPAPPPDALASLAFEDPSLHHMPISDDESAIPIEEIFRPTDEDLPDCGSTALVRFEPPPQRSRASSPLPRRRDARPPIPVRVGNFDILLPQEMANQLSKFTFQRYGEAERRGRRRRKFATGHTAKSGCSRIARQILDNFSGYKKAFVKYGRCMCCSSKQHSSHCLSQ